jgi:hypothetical protein
MGMFVFTVSFPFQFSQDVEAVFEEKLELSLDCALCLKKQRTVVMYPERGASFCTPTHHPYSAQINDFTVTMREGTTEALYTVAYDYTSFEDTRDQWRSDPSSHEMPTWGRVYFALTCPGCGQKKRQSTQSNIVRPWKCRCSCGYLLYEETRTIPLFESIQ